MNNHVHFVIDPSVIIPILDPRFVPTTFKGSSKITLPSRSSMLRLDLGEPTHTLVPCWMPKPLPTRNQCMGGFAPAPKSVLLGYERYPIFSPSTDRVPGKFLGHIESVKIRVILNPTGYMLDIFRFCYFHLFEVYSSIDSSKMIGIFPEVLSFDLLIL